MQTPSGSPQTLITCPNETCNLESIEHSSLEENLGAFDDQVLSLPLNPENDPVLNFANQLHSHDIHHGAVVVIQADYHEVSQPSGLSPDDRAAHQAMHGYGGGCKAEVEKAKSVSGNLRIGNKTFCKNEEVRHEEKLLFVCK